MSTTALHAGHVSLPLVPTLVALTGAVVFGVLLRYLGVVDAIGGAFVAGQRRDEE